MSFNQSQRVFHEIDYNPPCNYYNPNQNNKKIILNGSLAGPSLLKNDKNTFGYNKRFQIYNNSQIPGPAQYFMDKKQIVYQFKKDLTKPKQFIKNTFRNQQKNPSIPYKVIDTNNLDEEDKLFLKELSLLENPSQAAQNLHKKQPSYSFSKSPRNIFPTLEKQKKKLNPEIMVTHYIQKIQQEDSVSAIYKINKNKIKQNQGVKKSVAFNQAIKKSTKKRNQIINSIQPDFLPSLQIIELMKKMRTKQIPGPGAYNTNLNDSFNEQIERTQQKGTKFTSVKRFPNDKVSNIGPGSYNINRDLQNIKGCIISKQKRNLFNLNQNTDLYHRFYIDPNSQSKTTVSSNTGKCVRSNSCTSINKKVLLQSKDYMNAFGSNTKRFSISTKQTEDDKISILSDFQIKKKNQFKEILKNKIKKLHSEDRRSTKQDSGLLGIQTMALFID